MLTPKQISEKIRIGKPLKNIVMTQPFGANYVNFYAQFGLKGHNGQDFRIYPNMPCYSVLNNARVTSAVMNSGYGNHVRLMSQEFKYDDETFKLECVYGHLKSLAVKKNQIVDKDTVLGICDNTGKYTTGNHLHFGVRVWYKKRKGQWAIQDNGYAGYIDQSELYRDKHWDTLPVERRYDRADVWKPSNPGWRPWHAWLNEKKVAMSLWRSMKYRPSNKQINACAYGGWDKDAVINPAMYPNWAWLKKGEFMAGKRPPLRLTL